MDTFLQNCHQDFIIQAYPSSFCHESFLIHTDLSSCEPVFVSFVIYSPCMVSQKINLYLFAKVSNELRSSRTYVFLLLRLKAVFIWCQFCPQFLLWKWHVFSWQKDEKWMYDYIEEISIVRGLREVTCNAFTPLTHWKVIICAFHVLLMNSLVLFL